MLSYCTTIILFTSSSFFKRLALLYNGWITVRLSMVQQPNRSAAFWLSARDSLQVSDIFRFCVATRQLNGLYLSLIFGVQKKKKGTPRPSTPVLECWLLKTRRIGNLIEMEKCIRRRHVKCAGRSFLWNLLKPFYMLILSWKWNEITCTVVSKRSLFIVFFLLWQSIRIVTAAQLLRFRRFSILNYESAGSNFILVDIVTYYTQHVAQLLHNTIGVYNIARCNNYVGAILIAQGHQDNMHWKYPWIYVFKRHLPPWKTTKNGNSPQSRLTTNSEPPSRIISIPDLIDIVSAIMSRRYIKN